MTNPLAWPTVLAAVLHGDGTFSWTHWDVHPSVAIGCLLLVGVYLAATHTGQPKQTGVDGVDAGRSKHIDAGRLRRLGTGHGNVVVAGGGRGLDTAPFATFVGGVAVIFVALNGPIHDLSDNYLFSAHMVQHLLLMMVAPPLLLLGIPARLLRPLAARRGIRPVVRFLTRPLIAFAIYNIVLVGWHFPAAYNLALVNHDVHIAQHLMFMAAAVIMWWPIVNPVPDLTPTLASPLQMIYLFAMGIPMSVLSAMVTFADGPLYTWYTEAPRIFELSAYDDQKLGGVIMWVPGSLIFWTAISLVFYRWSKREEDDERRARDELRRRRVAAAAAGRA